MAGKQRWGELSSQRKATILGLVALQAILVAAAERDLSGRADGEVRGPKMLWRVLTASTPGAVVYFVAGRR